MTDNKRADTENLRREYLRDGLRRSDLTSNPLDLFAKWLGQACEAQLTDPTAMCLATSDINNQPFQRIVLLKHFDDNGLVFYTNLESHKAQHLRENPKVSLLFPWHMLDRQVIFVGEAERLSTRQVLRYFASRPKESQIAAWVSQQSTRIASRTLLESQFFELKKKFQHGEVPLPEFWGGFRVRFASVEFWKGGEHRLHDRFIYQRDSEREEWKMDRLAP